MQFRQIYFLVELEELDADVVKRTSLKFVNYFWNIIYQHLKFLIFPKLFNVSKTTYMLIDTHFHLRKPLKFVETIFFFFLFTTHIFIFHLSMWSHSKTSFFVCVCVQLCVCFMVWQAPSLSCPPFTRKIFFWGQMVHKHHHNTKTIFCNATLSIVFKCKCRTK